MSVVVMARVWKVEGLSPAQKLVLLKLADCAHDDGGKAFPSQPTIARECGIGVRHVRRILDELESQNRITIEARRGPHPAMYHVLPPTEDRTPESYLDRPQESDLEADSDTPRPDLGVHLDRTFRAARPDISSSAYKEVPISDPSGTIRSTRLTPRAVENPEEEGSEENPSHPNIQVLTRMVKLMLTENPLLQYATVGEQAERVKAEAIKNSLAHDEKSIRTAIESAEAKLRLSPSARAFMEGACDAFD